ncbi:carbohydrate kinase family protein [Salipaludibacillus sp. HK11]|uniref:carbohydrate kinase family protein n=1 Tax=Salipaludibacillus sp. HK11 TaxID=3394320 RepID=UPI0039FBB514
MTNNKVVVAGHVCIDITPVFSSNYVGNLKDILAPGKLVHVEQADIHTGGAVANTGLAMKYFGADTKLIGKIGQDHIGELILNILRKHEAGAEIIIDPDTSSSYTIVFATPGSDRFFLHNPGANDIFFAEDVKDEVLKETTLFHFGYPPIMKSMYQNNGDELLRLFKKVKGYNVATSLDMAAIDADSGAGKIDWEKILRKVLPFVDFFVPSVEELGYMLDKNKYDSWLVRADGKDITSILSVNKDVKPLADKLINMGAKVVLIKCGAAGMYFRTADKTVLLDIGANLSIQVDTWANQEGFENSYQPEKVLSATGAGDTSVAAFLKAVLDGYPLSKCMQFATATGSLCVASYDALSGLRTFSEIEEIINRGWVKQDLS